MTASKTAATTGRSVPKSLSRPLFPRKLLTCISYPRIVDSPRMAENIGYCPTLAQSVKMSLFGPRGQFSSAPLQILPLIWTAGSSCRDPPAAQREVTLDKMDLTPQTGAANS